MWRQGPRRASEFREKSLGKAKDLRRRSGKNFSVADARILLGVRVMGEFEGFDTKISNIQVDLDAGHVIKQIGTRKKCWSF